MSILSKSAPNILRVGTTSNNLVTLDEDIVSTEPVMSDEELLKHIMGKENDKDEIATDEYDHPAPARAKANELFAAIETIHNNSLFIENGNEVQKNLRSNLLIKIYKKYINRI